MIRPQLKARRMLSQARRTVCQLGKALSKYLSVEPSSRLRLVERACAAKNRCDGSAAIKKLNKDRTALLVISRDAKKKSVRTEATECLAECIR